MSSCVEHQDKELTAAVHSVSLIHTDSRSNLCVEGLSQTHCNQLGKGSQKENVIQERFRHLMESIRMDISQKVLWLKIMPLTEEEKSET